MNFLTTYEYDVLDDLTKVIQDNNPNNPQQPPRVFVYDSLKRLTSAINPESGTVSYQYDNNSNLSQKTDARGVVTYYVYDALNRVTTILYRVNGQPDSNTGDVQYLYDNAVAYGKGRPWLTYKWGSKPSHTAVGYYDALGRVKQLWNLFGDGQGGWSAGFEVYRDYDLAGNVRLQKYPSGHTVSYSYDTAGRTSSFSGDLGDGANRNYASSFIYNARSQMTQELFGTQTPLYHKLQYNIRGHLWDVRVSTGADINGSMNRGCLQFFYDGSLGYGTSGPDNNGNVLFANTYIQDAANNTWAIHRQSYSYDSVNRISSVAEYYVSNSQVESQQSLQSYTYDRFGNRTINPASWGVGINTKQFTVDINTNRLSVPSGQSGAMSYDNAGNLISDTYTGAGSRVYDAENRITQAWGGNNQWQYYTYNANGQRVRRNINNTETWQIYGIDGELLAEYPAFGVTGSPQKEYGYRSGELLVTAEPGSKTEWLVPDHLGTPRIILDQTGSFANVRRHDYLPFGEELFGGTVENPGAGGRTDTQGYVSGDGMRQQFTQKERDVETQLDYFLARYYSSTQGRFSSVDPLLSSSAVDDPQSWNRYSYVLNNPLKLIDPDGLYVFDSSVSEDQKKNFNAALRQARTNLQQVAKTYGTNSREYKKAERALSVYGAEGVKNGVTIFAKTDVKAGGTQVEGVAGAKTADNPTGQNIRVAFNPSAFNIENFGDLIGHEGSHAADGSDWVKNNFNDVPTDYQGEVDAFTVQSVVNQSHNPDSYAYVPLPYYKQPGKNPYLPEKVRIWDSGWNEADRATLRRANIDSILSRPKPAGGYNLTPTSTKPEFIRGIRFPK